MKMNIIQAEMRKEEDGSFVGKTIFQVESHRAAYEITFYSKKGKEWDYSLNYAAESGLEEQMMAVDTWIEEDDEGFDTLLDAALHKLEEE